MSKSKTKTKQDINDPFSFDYHLNKMREEQEQAEKEVIKRRIEVIDFWVDFLEFNKKTSWEKIQYYNSLLGIKPELHLTKLEFLVIKLITKK